MHEMIIKNIVSNDEGPSSGIFFKFTNEKLSITTYVDWNEAKY